jgi:ATP-binding cassette subfamily C protein
MKKLDSKNLSNAISLLPEGTSKKLILLCLFQALVTFLDVLAILLIGLITKSGLDYVQKGFGEIPSQLSNLMNLESLDFEMQFGVLTVVIFILFTSRTTISIYGNKRILRYLGNQGATASNSLLDRILKSGPHYVVNKNSQEVLYGLTQGIDNLILNYLGSLTLLITEAIFLGAIIFTILILQPITGICALLIFGGAFYSIQRATSGKGKEMQKQLGDLSISYNQGILETIYIYRELVLRGGIAKATVDIRERRQRSMKVRAQLFFLPILAKYLFEFILILGALLVALIQLLVSDASAAVSALVVFLAAASRILPSLVRAQGALLAIKQSEGGSEVTIGQMAELSKISKTQVSTEVGNFVDKKFTANVEISNLNFRYSEFSKFSLEDISLDIKPATFVAIVGESGSGKTTLVDLVLGMNNPNSGYVKISGTKSFLAALNWPGKIAYVPQNIYIIDGSIRKNVTLDSADSDSDSLVVSALNQAKLLEDVMKMPGGLDEIVGERGMKLSGGQRQRLGIARALFSQPELIVFDEATSALDSVTEKAVTDAIFTKKNQVTLIVIAHRLSTVRNADLVVLLDNGKLIAKGTFEEVRKIAPMFDKQAKLVNL